MEESGAQLPEPRPPTVDGGDGQGECKEAQFVDFDDLIDRGKKLKDLAGLRALLACVPGMFWEQLAGKSALCILATQAAMEGDREKVLFFVDEMGVPVNLPLGC